MSLNVQVKGQGHQGQKMAFSAFWAACVWLLFGKTSLASSSSLVLQLSRMTLTFNLDLYRVKVNQYTKYPGQSSFSWKRIIWTRRHTHIGLNAPPGPTKSSVMRLNVLCNTKSFLLNEN